MDIDKLIERVEKTHADYLEKKNQFQQTMTAKAEEVDGLKLKIEDLNSELDSLKEQLAQKDHIEENNAQIDDLNEEIERLKTEINVLNKNADHFEELKNNLQTELTDVNTAKASAENKYASLFTQKQDLEVAFKELQDKYNLIISDDKADQLKDRVTELENEKQEHLQKEIQLADKNAALEGEISSLRAELAEKDKIIEGLRSPVHKKTNSLQDFIDSTIPVPEESAAMNVRQVKRGSEISEGTVPYKFGRTSPKIMQLIEHLIDRLFEGSLPDNEGYYPLRNPLIVIEEIGMDKNTYQVAIERLQAMTYNSKPLVFYNGNMYYATMDRDSLKKYITES